MIAEGLSCVSVSPYRRLSQTNCSLLSRSRERSRKAICFRVSWWNPLTPTLSFTNTKHRHQEKRIMRVMGFYTSEETLPRSMCQRNAIPVWYRPYMPRAYSSRSLYFSTRCVGVLGSASRKRTLCGILKRARRASHHACNSSAVVWAPGLRTT